ncbi:MAG: hypothetical protein JWO06_3800 [Bacteroidota bacterium]|nr:hypothetical protein [Bacteroidota bacterium]
MKKVLLLTFYCLSQILLCSSQANHWLWAKSSGGGTYGEGWASALDRSGNLCVTGFFAGDSTITFDTIVLPVNSHFYYQYNFYVAKYSPSGNAIWVKTAVNRDTGSVAGLSIATDADNNIYATGYYSGDSVYFGNILLPAASLNGSTFFIVKYDSAGNVKWVRTGTGGGNCQGTAITADANGNTAVTGYYTSTSVQFGAFTLSNPNGGPNNFSIFVAGYDASGNIRWAKMPVTDNVGEGQGRAIANDGNGNFYTTGWYAYDTITFDTSSLYSNGTANIYMVKYDSLGNALWAKNIVCNTGRMGGIAATKSGYVYITGFSGDGGPIIFDSIIVQGGSPRGVDFFIAAYNSAGKVLWAKSNDYCFECLGLSVAADSHNNVYVGGEVYSDSLVFDNTPVFTTPGPGDPLFVLTLDSLGNLICSTVIASGGDDFFGLSVDDHGNAYIASDYEVVPFVIGLDTLGLTGALIGENIFIAKFHCPSCTIGGSFNYQLSSAALCSGDSALISFTGGSALSISPANLVTWSDSLHAIIKPDTTTIFTIGGYLPCGTFNSQSFTLPVLGNSVSITSNKTAFCPGDSAQICAPSGFSSYNWSTGDTTACIYAKASGNYYLTVSQHGNCTAVSNRLYISAFPNPVVSVSIRADTITAYNGTTYQWYMNGNILQGETSASIVGIAGQSYRVLVTDSNGCTGSSAPIVILSIPDLQPDVVKVFPNPSTGAWQLSVGESLVGCEMKLFDSSGRLLFKSKISDQKSIINVPDATPGVYELRITSGSYNIIRMLVKM